MIHQCYFREDQLNQLFSQSPYRPFGLEPELNPRLLEVCPELADAATRLALVEYAAMLYHWRDREIDTDNWIGFTSYRQLDKSPFVFQDKAQVEAELAQADVVSWGVWDVSRMRLAWLKGAAAQAETASPLLHRFTVDVLKHFGISVPSAYFVGDRVPFANYWALSRQTFERYMTWSWPIIAHALALEHPYKQTTPIMKGIDQRKAVGYFAERLFAIWAMREGLSIQVMGELAVA